MATSFADSGPLDEYFRDESGSSSLDEHAQGQRLNMEMDFTKDSHIPNDSGDVTLVDRPSISPMKGWTGSIASLAGPSSIPLSILDVPGKFPSPSRLTFSDESFAERFKYLICSSGLLEKDYVPVLVGNVDSEAGDEKKDDQSKANEDWTQRARERWDLVLACGALIVGLTISLGIWIVLGIGLTACLVVMRSKDLLPVSLQMRQASESASSSQDDTPQTQALMSLTNFISCSNALNNTLSASLFILDPHPYSLHSHNTLRVSLHRFTGNMTDHLATATSALLEMADKKELSVLGEMYDIPVVGSFFHSRRRQSITDSSSEEEFDSYYSSLSSIQRPVSPHRPSSLPSPDNKHCSGYLASSLPNRLAPSPLKRLHSNSPHSHRYSFGSLPDKEDRFTQIPDRTPRLSKRASVERLRDTWSNSPRFERPRHERRITEADEEEEDFTEGETSRSSDQSVSSDDSTPMKSSIRRPSSETEGGNLPSMSPKSPPVRSKAGLGVTIPRTPILTREREIPRSSSPFKHVPSPLSRRMSASGGLQPLRTALFATPTSRSAPNSTALLPSPFMPDNVVDQAPLSSAPLRAALSLDPTSVSASANSKRRSLQNMPYYSSSDDQPVGRLDSSVGLTRTRSMPLSDLQALRSASTAGGSKSRRSSLNPLNSIGSGLGIGFPINFPANMRSSLNTLPPPSPTPTTGLRRIESVSPLTLPALKASCLGIHLKRRRLACCLLGLKFSEKSAGHYWVDVKEILDDLAAGIKQEKALLENVVKEAEQEAKIMRSMDRFNIRQDGHVSSESQGIDELWTSSSSTFAISKQDFAPRTSDEALLSEHIDKLSNTLAGAWKELTLIKGNMIQSNSVDLVGWHEIRGQLGQGLREWERGKEIIHRMNSNPVSELPGEEDAISHQKEVVPDFMKAWNDEEQEQEQEQTSPETSLESHVENLQLEEEDLRILNQTQYEILPPVGKDDIFETTSMPLSDEKILLSKLTREERIKLTKISREKGLSLKQLLKVNDDLEVASKTDSIKMRERGGLVLDELKCVIGSIRRIKDGGDFLDLDKSLVDMTERESEKKEEDVLKGDAGMMPNGMKVDLDLDENVKQNGNQLENKITSHKIRTSTNDHDNDHHEKDNDDTEHGLISTVKDQNEIHSTTKLRNMNPFILDIGELKRNLPSRINHEDEILN
ncbi:uncharacterized protein I206_105831 [Kwoniella pini CBS 10737]|uniref:Uncharacterized protein n=1 Tax=Kwoniella pini CBS 10737 TaxID=1296096 RepID=A0A1B9I0C7_9TREE|nr:uncharacterized protein I206_04651 [Kwoniella pini CBS 10737]OCF48964.1 hypothetical protein I206_04651 [Kwoniella pini CBS 10737]